MIYVIGCWKRLKIDAKKEADNNRRAAHITGGGPAPLSLNPSTQVVLSVLGDSIEPLPNPDDPPSPLMVTYENIESLTSTNEHSNSAIFSPVVISDVAVRENVNVADDPPPPKRQRINSLEKAQIQLIEEGIKTEKMKQDTENIKQDTERKKQEAEQLNIELLRLRKLKLLQELKLLENN
ncbi:uncharacterized protein [Centruroides vittatus]|uniref:uncharacterized protein n=1 Tax=Centruroides vittatus TaxID=120091 RepID=UPI00350F10EE